MVIRQGALPFLHDVTFWVPPSWIGKFNDHIATLTNDREYVPWNDLARFTANAERRITHRMVLLTERRYIIAILPEGKDKFNKPDRAFYRQALARERQGVSLEERRAKLIAWDYRSRFRPGNSEARIRTLVM